MRLSSIPPDRPPVVTWTSGVLRSTGISKITIDASAPSSPVILKPQSNADQVLGTVVWPAMLEALQEYGWPGAESRSSIVQRAGTLAG